MAVSDTKHRPYPVVLGLLASLLFVLGYWPAFQILFSKWWASEAYTHAFLVLPIILYMVWEKRSALPKAPVRSALIGLTILLVSVPVYLFALLTQVHTVIALATVLTLVGAIVFLGGLTALRLLIMPLLLLLLLIPVPDPLMIQITFPLQLKVSQIGEAIVHFLGVPIFREGNIMTIPGKSFEVVEACSGMRSIMTLITLAVIVGYFALKRIPSKLILALASIPLAILINIFRVVVMILAFHWFEFDLSEGSAHTLLGLFVFIFGLLLFFPIQRILNRWETSCR
jgi:exosortase